MKVINGRVFDPAQGFVARDLATEGSLIVAEGSGEVIDAAGCYVIPGLVDVHFHGAVVRISATLPPRACSALPTLS